MASFTRTSTDLRESRRDEVASQLIGGIEALVARGESVSEVSVDRLASEAGLSRSSFYRYFADKGELLETIWRTLESERKEAGLAAWRLPGSASQAEFADAIHDFIKRSWAHRAMMGAAMEATAYDSVLRDAHEANVTVATDLITEHITTGQDEGWVRPELDPAMTAWWCVHMADRGLLTIVNGAAEDELGEIADALVEILWRTLYEGHRDPEGGAWRPR